MYLVIRWKTQGLGAIVAESARSSNGELWIHANKQTKRLYVPIILSRGELVTAYPRLARVKASTLLYNLAKQTTGGKATTRVDV